MPHIHIKSKAFRKGFLDGFTAYYTYFRPRFYTRAHSVDPSIAAAWDKVGDALRSACDTERGSIGKTSRKTSAGENVAA